MIQYLDKQKCIRGVIHTLQGLEKLEQAKAEAEFQQKGGIRYTLEQMKGK